MDYSQDANWWEHKKWTILRMPTGGSNTHGRSSRRCLTCYASATAGPTVGFLWRFWKLSTDFYIGHWKYFFTTSKWFIIFLTIVYSFSRSMNWIILNIYPGSPHSLWRTCGWRCWAWWVGRPAMQCSSDMLLTSYSRLIPLDVNTGSFIKSWLNVHCIQSCTGRRWNRWRSIWRIGNCPETRETRSLSNFQQHYPIHTSVTFSGILSTDIRVNSSTKSWFLGSFRRSSARTW